MSPVSRYILYNLLGIFLFFVPISLRGSSSIPLDHLVTGLIRVLPGAAPLVALVLIVAGAIQPFYDGSWRHDFTGKIFAAIKLCSIPLGIMAFLRIGPEWLLQPDMLPFLFEKICIPLGFIVPIGGAFLTFIINYGLLETVSTVMRPVMRSLWRLPGRAAINAVASFIGSFSIGMFLTNRLLKEGKYTVREAAIIITGFSTVSVTFMVIVAKTLGLMPLWNTFFWSAFVVTYVVTAVTARIPPLSTLPDVYIGPPSPEEGKTGSLWRNAINSGLEQASRAGSLWYHMGLNFRDAVFMAMRFLPVAMPVGLAALVLAKMTPVFDILGYVFYPFCAVLGLPEPLLVAKACAIAMAEMFIPNSIVASAGAPLVARFVVGVVSISTILFFAGTIPIVVATDVRLSMGKILAIMVERIILSLILAGLIGRILF
ncbi:MAG TPA: histidine transporter [Peptococcaceae bacterium]|nr:histidine transporter [Peptococcaceae bacterium]